LKNFFIFGILSALEYKRKILKLKDGTLFFLFVTLYGLLRFLVTFFRIAEDYILGLGTGQWFSLAMFFVGSYFLYKLYK
jgi:prolipoprotein diacylglyceryltransferase